jgi:hypothetical protein
MEKAYKEATELYLKEHPESAIITLKHDPKKLLEELNKEKEVQKNQQDNQRQLQLERLQLERHQLQQQLHQLQQNHQLLHGGNQMHNVQINAINELNRLAANQPGVQINNMMQQANDAIRQVNIALREVFPQPR